MKIQTFSQKKIKEENDANEYKTKHNEITITLCFLHRCLVLYMYVM